MAISAGKKGVKDARLELIPLDALWVVARIFGFGASKYADRNWERGYAWSKSFGAMLRHLSLFWQGEDLDEESGLPHIAHAAWHALVLTAFYVRLAGEDDRPRYAFDLEGSVLEGLASMVAEVTNPDEIAAAKQEASGAGPGDIIEVNGHPVRLTVEEYLKAQSESRFVPDELRPLNLDAEDRSVRGRTI